VERVSLLSTSFLCEPFFLDRGGRRTFAICRAPRTDERLSGGVVFFAPFAEELNRTRRMTTLLAQALAAAGIGMLAFDFSGTGDSTGDFGDARLESWIDDGVAAIDWLAERLGTPITVVGLRFGAALALLSAQERGDRVGKAVLWQPVSSGSTMLTQFLRIRVAANMAGDGPGETTKALRDRIAAGEPLEVGGYVLAPALFRDIDRISLSDIRPDGGLPVHWLEVAADDDGDLLMASRRVVEAWRASGVPVEASTVAGEQFWATQELSTAPALIDATVAAVGAGRP
jgi:exosortase A-associated hydrolase 2